MAQVIGQTTQSEKWAATNWVSIPAPWRVDRVPTPDQQQWLIVLTGVVLIDFQGQRTDDWRRDQFDLILDLRDPLKESGRQAPPGSSLVFSVDQWAPYATINSIFDALQSVNAGYAVDSYRPLLADRQDPNLGSIPRVFDGLEVDVAVRDTDAVILRVGYQVTLVGRIVVWSAPGP